ncbi:MAG: FliM/FliN family flagellar motor switch protein [Plesiomonas shigelloides]
MDVKVNGTLLGHAEVVIVNNKYGLRLTNVVDSDDMLKGLSR